MLKALNLMIVGTLLLAACAGLPAAGPEKPSGVVVEYQKTGGIAGSDELWTIYGDGRVTYNLGGGAQAQTREWQVTEERVQAVLDQAEELGFFKMQAEYMPLDTCCDRFTYRVTVNGANGSNTVTTIDAAKETPAELWTLIDQINQLVQE